MKKDPKSKNLITFEFLAPDTQKAILEDVHAVCQQLKRMKNRLSETDMDAMADAFQRLGTKLISKAMFAFAKGADTEEMLLLLKEQTKDSPFLSRVLITISNSLS